ncbi:MAG TPA: helix-turn-helix domain-containing protein [Acidimicrobiia bacterium]|jgi:DNA-binding transcriptional ArsR family regulator|nr:helix-turn-helix domain-containing protein [Acidimicrobiia bacterium]
MAVAQPVHVVEDIEALQVLGHPLRVRILEALRQPGSAATVAREVGETRQKVNYHLKELERVGLVTPVGERRSGNFMETLYQAVARSFLVSPQVAWSDRRRVDALRAQHSLERLVMVGGQLQRDAISLLDRAAFDGEQIASTAVEVDVHFADEKDRAAFLDEYLNTVQALCDRYGSRDGMPYRVVLAAHPMNDATTEGSDEL